MRFRLHATFTALAIAALLTGCDGVGLPLTSAALAVDRWRADLVAKDIELPGGARVAYLEGGRGEPLVLVHGFGCDKDDFARVARWLTPHYRVIVPDLAGFGGSTPPPDGDFRYATQAVRLHAFVHALGLAGVHLGGNSMGGAIAMSYAAQFPQEVGSLWLLDPAGIAGAPPGELAQIIAAGGRNPMIVTTEDDFARLVAFAMSDPPYMPRAMMNVLARQRIANQPLERLAFTQIARDSVSTAIEGLGQPTLIVWGAEDRLLSPGTVPVLKTLLPQAQAVVMPHVGHLPMLERPQESADDYLRFRAGFARVATR
jgi:pimeloyl-ACP methyl ester carboxylesterase